MKGYFVYCFYDHYNTLLYVGKTANITERMRHHLSLSVIKKQPWKDSLDRKNIILHECHNPTDLEIYETFFINKYRPIHNREKYYRGVPSFDLPYLEPLNPFIDKMKTTNAIMSLWEKATREEKEAVLIITGIEEYYLSLDKDRDVYLDERKYGQIYTREKEESELRRERYQSEY